MNNKKLIIIITSAVLTLVILVGGIVLLLKNEAVKDFLNNSFAGGSNDANSEQVILTEENKPAIEKGRIVFEDAKGKPGETVGIPITLKSNPGMWGGALYIEYNSDELRFVGCENGEVFDDCQANEEDGVLAILITNDATEDTEENGVIATLNFKIKVSADEGKYEVKFKEETEFCNILGRKISPKLDTAKITVKE